MLIGNQRALIGIPPKIAIPMGGLLHKYVPLMLNQLNAPFNRTQRKAAAEQLNTFIENQSLLAKQIGSERSALIPRVLHFVSLSKSSEPLPFFVRMAIETALHHNPKWKAIFHFSHEPHGQHWCEIKNRLTLSIVPDFDFFGIAPLLHFAHKADVVRALALKIIGGAYLDLDTLTLRTFEPLRDYNFVMGIQPALPGQPGGLCNAVMFGQPNAEFLELWLREFSSFRSRKVDWLWDFMSVKTPSMLANKYPSLITVLQPEALFHPLWDKIIEILFTENADISLPNFAVHLWGNTTRARLETLDESYLRNSNSPYAKLARPALGLEA